MSRSVSIPLLLCVGLVGLSCAKRPVLYPNAKYEQVGAAAANQAIDQCMAKADAADLEGSEAADAAISTGTGAAVGGATGAVAGAISGGAGTGAAVGAAVGGMVGFFSWMFGTADPDPLYVSYVDTCLANQGYQPIGWK